MERRSTSCVCTRVLAGSRCKRRFAAWWNENGILGCKIESVEAVLNVSQLALPGLTYGIILGAMGSLQLTVSQVVWAKYYGRRHLGSVTGVAMLVSIAGSALGPMPMGIARDVMGSYLPALTISAALPLVLAVVALFARQPEKHALKSLSVGG